MECFPRTHVIGDPPEDPIELEVFKDRIIFMSMFNNIEWTKRGNSERCISNANKSRMMRRDSREDTGHSSALEMKRNGMELSAIHLKENGIPQPLRWWNDSEKPASQCSRVSVL